MLYRRTALLSNVTIEVLASILAKDMNVWHPVGFGAWMETALEPPEALRTFDPEVICLVLDPVHAPVDPEKAETARVSLLKAFPRAAVHVLDVEDVLADLDSPYDDRMWRYASMPWSLASLSALCEEVMRLARHTPLKKVLAVDFDNTLWQGIVGEDGVEAIVPHTDFQRDLKDLVSHGVVLVGLSKNDPADVEPVWSRPGMVLAPDDFAAIVVNWKPKPDNLRKIAARLNLAIDSFVFLDDNPGERAQMEAEFPAVSIAPFPCSVRRLKRLYFPERPVTPEDAARTAGYRADKKRQAFSVSLDLKAYLREIHMVALIRPATAADVPRLAQLAARSNQFNVLTSRCTEAEFAADIADPSCLVLKAALADSFGDLGLVAFVRVRVSGEEAEILDWTMSCRAMNRRFEFAVEEALESRLVQRGVRTLKATWRKTPKNTPVSDLFDRFGFERVTRESSVRRYVLALPRVDHDAWEHFVIYEGGSYHG